MSKILNAFNAAVRDEVRNGVREARPAALDITVYRNATTAQVFVDGVGRTVRTTWSTTLDMTNDAADDLVLELLDSNPASTVTEKIVG